MFAFDRLSINEKTIIGILLSVVGGTVFSYLEYTNKQTKNSQQENDENSKIDT